MKTYPYLINKLFCQPVMLLDSVWVSLEHDLLARMGLRASQGIRAGEEDDTHVQRTNAEGSGNGWRVDRIYQSYGNVGVLNISGVIDKFMSDSDLDCYGGLDLEDVDTALAIAAGDDELETLVLNINSPGGSVLGVPETAARVRALAQFKEVRTFVGGMCCSAATYIGSQADQVDTNPSAIHGSVGVYCAVLDQSKALEMKGYNVQLIKAGKYKAAGAFSPLTDEERAMMQERVTNLHTKFRAAVNGTRPQVSVDDMEGQTFDGEQAVRNGLADNLTGDNIDEYVAKLLL